MATASRLPCPPHRPVAPGDGPETAQRQATETNSAPRRWRSSEIFGKAQVVEIEHGDSIYRLRLTAMGKLILTK